jgi:phosphoglycolate phosphatase-like HAD superfamily hydrolase
MDVWYVGDLKSDCTAARNAGISFAWASWGYSSEMPAHASMHLSSFSEVLAI